MKSTILILFFSIMSVASFSQARTTKQMETIVLVHGAWSDATAWDAVVGNLKAKGHEVVAVNLPGHGTDTASFAGISLQSYVDAVKTAIGDKKNVVLVGHSMAGIVISEVAEQIPGQIKELVYLAAYLPKNGESLLTLAQKDAGSHTGKYLQIDKDHGAAIITKDGIVDVFLEDAPKNVQDYVIANWKTEPLAPLATPATLTDANYGSVKKAYIYTAKDHAISYPYQQTMVQASGVKKTFLLDSSHTPFISVPNKLAADILAASK
ncbi:alpha/beta fold hydrolase [Mucilaginibacter sp.]|jgi:pimeloyl-ACP methyl ester carboxylesterase|uniref:alpha/beta fold hydrolase n=1 Tax=Mucilaginibacter sp. TaxID=1882438 RepID=UPI00356AA233